MLPLQRLKRGLIVSYMMAAMIPTLSYGQSTSSTEDMLSTRDRDPTIYRVSVPEPLDTLVSSRANSAAFSDLIHRNVYETLVKLDSKGDVYPWLAQKWEMNVDGTVLIFFLRRDVKFHDGSVFNCDDVQRIIRMRPAVEDTPFRPTKVPVLAYVKRSVCLNSYELQITLKQPYYFAVSDFASVHMGIFDRQGGGLNEIYVGTGPFRLQQQGGENTLLRNEDYWHTKPILSEVRITVEPDDQKAVDLVLQNKVDLAIDVQDRAVIDALTQQRAFIEKRDHLRLLHGLREDKLVMAFNYGEVLLRRRDLRCAMVYAIDRPHMNHEVFYGKGKEIYGMQSAFHPRYVAQQNNIKIKALASARVMLAELRGDSEVTTFRILFEDTPQNRHIVKVYQRMISPLGIGFELNGVDFDEYRDLFYKQQDYDLVLVNHPGSNMMVHYSQSENIYGSDKRKFRKLLNEALSVVAQPIVTTTRIKSLLDYQYQTCQHNFLLQRPIFFVSRGRYQFPDMNQPAGGVDLSGIIPEEILN